MIVQRLQYTLIGAVLGIACGFAVVFAISFIRFVITGSDGGPSWLSFFFYSVILGSAVSGAILAQSVLRDKIKGGFK